MCLYVSVKGNDKKSLHGFVVFVVGVFVWRGALACVLGQRRMRMGCTPCVCDVFVMCVM